MSEENGGVVKGRVARHQPTTNKEQEKWAGPYLRDRRCMSARALALARVCMCVRVSLAVRVWYVRKG